MKLQGTELHRSIFILFVVVISCIGFRHFFEEPISDITTAITAVAGVLAILYQLKKEHDISRAEFIFNMNNSFFENDDINVIYKKLKRHRDSKDEIFSDEDGRLMGHYVMFFETMNYLIDETILEMKMVDKLFSSRFFIFANNREVQKHQLCYSGVMPEIFELYCKWFNYRKKLSLPTLYPIHQLHNTFADCFTINGRGNLTVNKNHVNSLVPNDNKQ